MLINWEKLISLSLASIILFSPLFRAALPIWAITPVYLIVLVALTIWLIRIKEDEEFWFTKTPLDFPILFFIFFASLSLVKSINIHQSISALYRLISYSLLYFLVTNNVKKQREINRLILSMLGVSIFVTSSGLVEFFTTNFTSPFSVFPNSNAFASFLLIPFSLVLGMLLFAKERKNTKRLILGIMGLLFLFAITTTRSRGACLSLFPIVIFTGVLKSRRYALVTLILLIFFSSLLPTPSTSPLARLLTAGIKDPYAYTRLSIWKSAFSVFKGHPFLGTGLGTFSDAFPGYKFPVEGVFARFGKKASFAHNEYLQLASEAGIFALGVFIWLLFAFFRKARRLIRDFRNKEEYGLIVGLTAGILGVFFHSLVDFPLHAPAVTIILSINMAIVMGLGSDIKYQISDMREKSTFLQGKRYYFYLVLIISILGYAIVAPYLANIYAGGAEAEKQSNPALAIRKYKRALVHDPLRGECHYKLADLYVQQYRKTGDFAFRIDAYKELKKIIKLEPKNAYYRRYLAKFYHQNFMGKARIDATVRELKKALELTPNHCFFYCELGSIYANEKRYEEAIRNYIKAIELEPNYSQAHYNLGSVYEELSKDEMAQNEYREAEEARRKGLNKLSRTPYEKQLITLKKRSLTNK